MDEMYNEIREHLRKSHYQNTQEVYQRERSPIYQYNYSQKRYVQGDNAQHTSWTFSLKLKIFMFLMSVMLFSCYLYGGQDLEKGASMVITEMKTEINNLEKKEPIIKETMLYVRKAYHEVYDLAKTYLD